MPVCLVLLSVTKYTMLNFASIFLGEGRREEEEEAITYSTCQQDLDASVIWTSLVANDVGIGAGPWIV